MEFLRDSDWSQISEDISKRRRSGLHEPPLLQMVSMSPPIPWTSVSMSLIIFSLTVHSRFPSASSGLSSWPGGVTQILILEGSEPMVTSSLSGWGGCSIHVQLLLGMGTAGDALANCQTQVITSLSLLCWASLVAQADG